MLTVVLILDHASVTGGLAKVALDSAVGLKRAGQRPIIFAAAAPLDPRLAAEKIETVCLGQPDLLGNPSKLAAAAQGIWNVTAAARLRGLLAALPRNGTIIHVHGWAKALSPSITAPIRRSRLPAVYTMHDYFLFCPNGGFYNYPAQRICKLKPLSGACWKSNCDSRSYIRKLWRGLRALIVKYTVRMPDVFSDIVLLNNFQTRIVRDYLPRKARIHYLSNPIDSERLGPKSAPADGDFLFVGRLSPEKGTLCFAEAARKAGIKPVFAGNGPMAERLAAEYPEAVLLGWKTPQEVRALMRAARAVIFPSQWYEGQPLTVLEALSLGTPVIVSDACAGRASVEHNVNGLWFASQNADALAAAIKLMQNDDAAARLSRAAYDRFWENPPTLDPHTTQLVRIYDDILAPSRVAA